MEMINNLKKIEYCFICNGIVKVNKEGFFLGIKDKYYISNAICKECSIIWNKHSELLSNDKSNFKEYAICIQSFFKNKKGVTDE